MSNIDDVIAKLREMNKRVPAWDNAGGMLWMWREQDGRHVWSTGLNVITADDADLACELRTSLPTICDEVERLQKENERLRHGHARLRGALSQFTFPLEDVSGDGDSDWLTPKIRHSDIRAAREALKHE